MKVFIEKDYNAMSKKAFEIIKNVISKKPYAILGFATGSTPIGVYREMVKDHKENETSYKCVKSLNLDEYVSLGKGDEQSYVTFMEENLFNHIDINWENTYLPNGKAEDLFVECNRYNDLLAKMPRDLQLLGIGSNGHIGFNEPGTSKDSVTHVVDLTENTIKDNSRFFSSIDDVPKKAISMGVKNILDAKKILVVASGANKADAVFKSINGIACTDVPASLLQYHNDVVWVIDEAAASKLIR